MLDTFVKGIAKAGRGHVSGTLKAYTFKPFLSSKKYSTYVFFLVSNQIRSISGRGRSAESVFLEPVIIWLRRRFRAAAHDQRAPAHYVARHRRFHHSRTCQ